jgi:hypothetical protein
MYRRTGLGLGRETTGGAKKFENVWKSLRMFEKV